MQRREFVYSSILESEAGMYGDVRDFLLGAGIPPETCRILILPISEAFTNALIHGNKLDSQKCIFISIAVNDDEIIADISDEGQGDPSALRSRKRPESEQEGGRGVDLMQAIADNLTISRSPQTGGIRVSMRFDRSRFENAGKFSIWRK
jgi:anti-sigma regulatory factor (Ser/Thr protein kinase)